MRKALAPEISTWPDDNPQLIGSQCRNCGVTAFPVIPFTTDDEGNEIVTFAFQQA